MQWLPRSPSSFEICEVMAETCLVDRMFPSPPTARRGGGFPSLEHLVGVQPVRVYRLLYQVAAALTSIIAEKRRMPSPIRDGDSGAQSSCHVARSNSGARRSVASRTAALRITETWMVAIVRSSHHAVVAHPARQAIDAGARQESRRRDGWEVIRVGEVVPTTRGEAACVGFAGSLERSGVRSQRPVS